MTREEVKGLLTQIKANYNEFIAADYVATEWYNQLKDYDTQDILRKYQEHLQGEYNRTYPRIQYLTKYLKKIQEKELYTTRYIPCRYCNEYIKEDDFARHYDRCLAIDYIERQVKRFNGKPIDKDKLRELSENDFNLYYDRILDLVSKRTTDEREIRIFNKIFSDNESEEYNVKEIMGI